MARLIPRKQIEEQQNITGSLEIGQDIIVGGNSIVAGNSVISGSLEVQNEFFLGNQLTDRGEITGSVFLTGSLEVDGELIFAGPSAVLSATASNALLAQDTLRYEGLRAKDFGANVPTLYVSSTDGNDANDGRTIQFPLRTIKRAAQLSQPGYDGRYGFDTGSVFNGYVIRVQAGTYLEDNPVILPSNTTIWGSGLRITKINARNPEQDLFWVNSGCYIAEVTMGGLRLWPDEKEPQRGFAVAFQPGAFITTSPYIQNCSQISNQENSFTELYEDIPPGGGGLYVNGDAIDPNSPLASMVLDAYTQISPNGVGCLVNGRGFIQLVSFFTNFSYYAIRVNNGGHATLNNSNISFGLFGMYASGSRFISGSGGNIDARDKVRASYSVIVDVLNKGLEAGLPSVTTKNTAAGIRATSVTEYPQYLTSSGIVTNSDRANEIVADFELVSQIVSSGTSDFPTLIAKSSTKGYGANSPYNILGTPQITSSVSASTSDLNFISSSYGAILDIFNDGTASYKFVSNTSASIKVTDTEVTPLSPAADYSSSLLVSSSFVTIYNIIEGGLSSVPRLVSNNSSSIKTGIVDQFTTGVSSSLSVKNSVSSSFSIVYNILANGTGSSILDIPQNHQKLFVVRKSDDNTKYTFDISGSGISNNTPPTSSNIFNVTNNGSGNYVINGQSNPTLNLIEGQTYTFNINASGHPFWIKTNISLGTGNAYNTGVTNNGTDNGTITFVVPIGAPTLYYNCQFHSSMAGTLNTLNSNTAPPTASVNTITGLSENPILTLFRGETYRFFVNAGLGPDAEPFFIRKQPISGFDYQNIYNYGDGVVNNGDSNGVITFQVPYNAPNKLYYISQDTPSFVGQINIYNSSTTPKELIANTLTYPATLASSSVASTDVDRINGYELLINNIPFIQSEVIEFISSSWSDFPYNEASCSRDVGFIVNGVAYDLLYGGNEESIRSGLFYYQFPSEATTTQLGPTLTAVKYAAGMAQRLLENRTFVDADNDNLLIAESIRDNKPFVQNETIAYLSSSWSGFPYNEVKCKRDVGYILDAVATDLVYGGNERAIEAGVYYYQYPSLAIVANITTGQLNQTLDGIKYAAGTTINIITGSTFVTQSESRLAAAELLIDNKALIQNETIQYINVQYPTLDYNTSKCRRDVGYIIDAVATDLIYDGNESSTRAGNFYYQFPSVATTTQRRETRDGFLYSKVIGESIVQNIILETPRIITNDERLIKVTGLNNVTESLGGTNVESSAISSSFAIIEQIIKRGVGAINSAIAQNSGLNWGIDNPLSVTTGSQTTSSYVQPNELTTIKEGFERVNSIIEGGVASIPPLTASVEGLIKVTNTTQTTGSSISSDLTSSISSSFGYVVRVISGGTGSLEPIVLNTSASIKITSTPQVISSNIGTNSETASISSSFGSVINIINNGLSVLPTLVQNTSASIKVSTTSQFTGSLSGSLEDIQFISQSISKVTRIIETGNVDLFGKQLYTSSISSSNVLAAYQIIRENIDFIQEETIAYLSSSWSTFEYDSVKCRRDIGLIISGAAEDLIWNANSASIVNGQFYYEFPSQATGNQLAQTLDGINYASRLAQKLVRNTIFVTASFEVSSSNALLFNNKEFIQNETIAYLSSSWGGFNYNETTCKRDVGYIIDAVRTDLVYGGNERSRIAGEYYFLFPSAATGSQLLQTTDGILYASRLAQSIVSGSVFVSANSEKVEASRLLRVNKDLIAAEVVEYVSSSWSGVLYDDIKCKRDVGFIIDAVRTDLVYGGNERTTIAGDFYYRFPSAATVGGVPTVTAQLDPTITGVEYGNRLSQKVILSEVLSQPSQSVTDAAEFIRESRDFIQQNTIDYVYEKYPKFTYDVARCRRDTGFIVDAVVTDLVYGGNERTSTAGLFYYKYPSQATNTQVEETVAAINYAKELTKLIAVDKRALEETFDSVDKVILSGSAGVSSIQLVKNTQKGIVVTGIGQTFNSASATDTDTLIVSSSFGNVINIINNGTGSIPTIVTNTQRGVNILGGTQITSSITPALTQQTKVGSGFDIVLDIIENGTGSLPTLVTNASGLIKRTNSVQYQTTASIANTLITSSNNSFDIVLDIVKEGTGSLPTLVKNAAGLLKVTNSTPYYSGIIISGSRVNGITGSFNTIINILEGGIGATPTIFKNTVSNIRTTGAQQYTSASSATQNEATILSASISIVTNIVANGTGSAIISASLSLPTSSYVTVTSSSNNLLAYGILKQNIGFIQDETIAYLSSSWSTASYNEVKCRRDIGLIISGAAEDLIFNSNSASVFNGVFYYDFPSQAQGAQLNQTLDGIFYASELAQKLIQNIPFNLPSSQSNAAYDLVVLNKPFIQNEVIAYISSSWSTHIYSESVCRRDVGHILDAVATDIKWGGNQRSVNAGQFYYLYPSDATGSQIQETVTGIKHARNLVEQILRGRQFTQVPHNRLEAKELIFENKEFIQNEVIAYVSASWNGFEYVEETCRRDVGFILDAVSTDLVYGGNERSIEAGEFYYRYPSSATTSQLGPTLSGIRHAKGLTKEILSGVTFVTASLSAQTAYNLLLQNKPLIQAETIAYVSSSWSEFVYNDLSCSRDTGYIVDAVATDILYGGNERVREAGEYYYLYPSLATVVGDGDSVGQLGQTLDGIKYAKGLSQNIVNNVVLESPTNSQLAGYELLFQNKRLLQSESIAFISSSWSGVDGFFYNQAKCARDVGYIVDAVATDLKYGGNERSSKAGEYYFLFPSAATVSGYANPAAQLDQTTTGIKFASGLAQKLVQNTTLVAPSYEVESARELLRNNVRFIQNETVEYVDAFYPSLVYLREKCRRDVGYILDAVITDLVYGGNERGIVAGDYYYRFPSLATGRTQVRETVDAVRYARELSKLIAQNVDLESPIFVKNIDGNIKASTATQFTASVSATTEEVSNISSSFAIVTDIIQNGIETLPIVISNVEGLIKVNNIQQITSSVSGGVYEVDLVSSSFKLIRDIIYNGSTSIPDSLVSNYEYGFENQNPTTYHITTITQSLGDGSEDVTSLTGSVSSSYGNVKNIITNGTGSIPTLIENTSSSLKVSGVNEVLTGFSGSSFNINKVGSSFGVVLNIIENGTSVIPTLVPNTSASIKVTDVPQFISGSSTAARLQGRIVSASFGLVIDTLLNNGTSSIQYKAPSATPNTNEKVTRAYDLLINNIPFIQAETVQFISSSWSEFAYNDVSCSRDVGLIVSGAAFDLLYGGNSASFVNGRFYFDYPSEATSSQLDQTVTAIRYAGGMAEKIVQGVIFESITSSIQQPTSASWDLLRKNKGFIQSESIAYLSSSWSEFEYSQSTCARDIGYIVDAVATDLLYGGNERSIVAGDYYYRFPSTATTSQLEPTLTGVRYAKGLAMKIVSGSTFQTASAKVDYAYDIIKDNKLFIQSESVAFVNAKFPHFIYDEVKCKRDLGYIIDAVITDLKWGGNERANKAGEFYYLYPSEATGVQVEETTAAVNYARLLTEQIMLNNLIAEPQPILNTIGLIKKSSANQYISSSINSESGSSYEASLISASISIVTNIIRNGTGSIATPVDYTTPSTASNVYYAYNLVKQNLEFIQNETIAYLSSSWSTASYDEAKCKRDIGFIVSGAIEDVLFGVNSASLVNGKFYWEFPSEANGTGSQIQQTLDGIFYASRLAQNLSQNKVYVTASLEVSASYELLRNNRQFIQSESISFISSSWDGFQYNQTTCMRDITHIIDAVSTDLFYGGNERGVIAGDYYFRFPSTATTTQLDPTVTGIEYAGKLASKLIKNEIFQTASLDDLTIRQLIRDNKTFIQSESLAYLTASWSTFDYDKVKCARDVGYIVDAAATDLLYGGNERSVTAGKYYYQFPSLAIVAGTTNGQLEETIDGIRYAGGVTQKVIQNILFQTASLEVSASFDLLRKNKPFIQAETIAYVSSSWSGVYYNEASCSRDVGFLIDAAATDLLYGGQERSVNAGSFYYLFPSRATNAGVPSEQNQLDPTVTGIRYAGRLSSRVIQKPKYETPSASVYIATDLLIRNRPLIQKETITFLSSSWSTLKYNEISCSRDLGFIIDAVRTDLIYGGNERSIEAGSIYYRIPSVAIFESYNSFGEFGQKQQTVDGINFAKGIAEKIVNNVVLTPPTTRTREAAQRLLGSKEILKKQAIGYTNGAFPYLVYNEASCSRDTGLIVDALVTDLIYGGNERGIEAASSYFNGQYGSAAAVVNDQRTETLETNRYLRTRAEFIAAGAPLESFGSLIVATGIDYSYNGSGVTFKALPPNQGGSGVPNPDFEITELGGGRIFFTSGNQDGDFRIGTGLSINQATGTLVGRTFSKSLFSLVTPFSLALEG